MQVDVTQVLQRVDEDSPYLTAPAVIPGPDGLLHENPESKPLTLRRALIVALDTVTDKMPLKKQLARHHLARRIQREDAPDFSAANIVALKNACADRWNPLLTGVICTLLEPDAPVSEDEA